jgi:hypothetical protein
MCTSCGDKEVVAIELQESQMRNICELATMDCYYHNVAKYKEEKAESFLWWSKDMHFWIEYSGIVTVGIDASHVSVRIKDNEVTVTLPPAKILDCKVDQTTLTEDSFIVAQNSAKINAEAERMAIEQAQENMYEAASNDKALLNSAQERAKELLEDYINNIGNSVGEEYTIKWVYIDENGKELTTSESGTVENSEIE